jgi:hypothetical protein
MTGGGEPAGPPVRLGSPPPVIHAQTLANHPRNCETDHWVMRPRDLTVLQDIIRARGDFGHREHVELAWAYLSRYELGAAQQAMAAAIRHLAGAHGKPDRYHDTVTRSWVQLVAVHRERWAAPSFDEFIAIAENRPLLERHLLDGHYSSRLIASRDARAGWAEPDLAPLPALA